MEKNGIIIYSFGEEYFLQLIVFLNSLRKHFHGEMDLYVRDIDLNDEKTLILETYNINIKIIGTDLINNPYWLLKPSLVQKSDFDNSLLLDTDMLIQGNIDDLFNFENKTFIAARSGLPLGQMQGIRREIKICNRRLAIYKMSSGCSYINIGTLGIRKSEIFEEYNKMVFDKQKIKYTDEIVFNLFSNENNTRYVSSAYNKTVKVPDDFDKDETKIIHFAWKSFNKQVKTPHKPEYIKKWDDETKEVIEKFPNYKFNFKHF